MEVNTIYAGQGDNAIIAHEGESLVVDVNWPEEGEEERGEQVERIMTGTALRAIILTGYDKDHANERGLTYYATSYGPEAIIAPKAYQDGEDEKKARLKEIAEENGIVWVEVALEDNSSTENIFAELCGKFSGELFSPHEADANEANNGSIVMKITGNGEGGWTYLVTGDTENERWETINSIFGSRLKSDGAAIPHHGSRGASNEGTAALVDADEAQASAGVGNQHEHPHKEAIEIWQEQGANVRTTNEGQGRTLTTWLDDDRLRTATRDEYELVVGIESKTVRVNQVGAGILPVGATGGEPRRVHGETS